MRPYSARAVQSIMLAVILLLAVFHAPTPPHARAGEAIRVGGPNFGTAGQYFAWNTTNITYTVDGGSLGLLNNATAEQQTVTDMFALWQAVPTSNISFTDGGTILAGPAGACVSADGDVDTFTELTCVGTTGNPIVFDTDGTLTDAVFGPGASNSILGFAGPQSSPLGFHTSGSAVLNGKWIDGINTPPTNFELTVADMQATALHEYGHFIGLGHSQINDHCFSLGTCADFSDDAFGIPTMYPTSFGLLEAPGVPPELTLSLDDIAWISLLYPDPTFATTHRMISGSLLASDGLSAIQGGNIIARQVNDGGTAINESLRCAVSVVSGDRYTGNRGQGITGDNPPGGPPFGDPFGSRDVTLFGAYSVPVPFALAGLGPAACAAANTDGMYTVQVESINSQFTLGSGVGPNGNTLGEVIPIPGPAEFFSSPETNSDATPGVGATVDVTSTDQSGINIILNGTANTNDAFEGAGRNDTVATATPRGNGTFSASISPLLASGPDMDVYSFTAVAGQMVTFNINARTLAPMSFLDSVVEVLDSGGARVNLCRATPGVGLFNQPCLNDDENPGVVRDSILEFQSAAPGTFFLRAFDWTGTARADFVYDLVITGAGAAPPPAGCTKDFVGGGVPLSWADGANWNPPGVPGLNDDVCIGALTVNYDQAVPSTIDTLTVNAGGTLNTTTGTLNVTSSVNVSGSLNVSGGTLNASASTIATLTMNGGTLQFNSGASTVSSLTFNSGVMNASGGTVALPGYTQNGTLRLNGGSVTVAGTLTLASGSIIGGAPGTLTATTLNQTGGTIGPGLSPGVLNVTANFIQAIGAVLNFEIFGTGGAGNPTGHDQINITGDATTDGDFNVTVDPGYTPTAGNTFTIATATGTTAGNNTLNLPDISAFGLEFTDANSTPNALILEVVPLSATFNFDGGGNGTDWEDTQNWDPDGVPMLTDTANIGGNFAVTISSAVNAGTLNITSSQPLTITPTGSLNVANIGTIGAGGVNLQGTLTGTATVSINGPLNWSGGTQSGSGTTTVASPLVISGATATLDTRRLLLLGAGMWTSGNIVTANGAIFEIGPSGIFDVQLTADATFGGGGTFMNGGTVNVDVGSRRWTHSDILNNANMVNLVTGTVSLNNGGTHTGDFTAAAGTTLEFGGGAHDLNSGASITGAGTASITGGIVNANMGSSADPQVLVLEPDDLTGAIFNVNSGSSITPQVLVLEPDDLTFPAAMNVNSGSTVNSAVSLIEPTGSPSNPTLNVVLTSNFTMTSLTQTGGTITGNGVVTINGGYAWSGGAQAGTGVTNARAGIAISGAANKQLSERTLNNTLAGTVTWTGAGNIETGNGAIFGNLGGGTFDIQTDADIAFTPGGAPLQFNNVGTFRKSAGAGSTDIDATFTNIAVLEAGSGTLNFVGAFMQNGTGGLTRLNGGSITTANGLMLNAGALESPGPGGMITGDVANNGATVQPGASPGSLVINGNYTQGPGGTLEIELGATDQFDLVTITGTATLGGTLSVLSFGGFTPVFPNSFTVMTYNNVVGDFATKNGLNISSPALTATAQATQYVLAVGAPSADLGVTKSDSPDPVTAGTLLTYTVTIANSGPDNAPSVVLTDTLPMIPGEISFGMATPSQGTCNPLVGNVLTCDLGTINNGANATVTITVTPALAFTGTLSNTAAVTHGGTDPNAANDSDTEMTTVNAPVCSTTSVASGEWSVVGTWDNGVPTAMSNACIVANHTVTVSAGANVANSLTHTSTAPFSITGGSLSLAASSSISAAGMNQSGGTLDGAGTLTIAGPFNWSGGTHQGAGTTTVSSPLNITGAVILAGGRTLNNMTAGTMSGAGNLSIGTGGVFNNLAMFDLQNNGAVGGGIGGAQTFNNTGTLTKSAGGGASTINATLNHGGTITITNGTLQLNGSGTHTGSSSVAGGTTLRFSAGTHNLNGAGATVTGVGTTEITTTVNFNAGSSITTAVNLSAGTATFLTGAAVNLPSLVQTGGTVAGTDTVNITALFPWSGGTQTDAGMTNPTGGMSITGAVTLVGGRTLNNTAAGTMSGAGNLSIGTGGVFSNSGMFDLQNNGAIGGGIGGAQTFNNIGTLTKSAGGGVSPINATLNQNGTITITDGTLQLNGSGTHTGSSSVAGGTTLRFSAGTHNLNGAGATVTGAGTTEITTTVNFNAGSSITTAVNLSAGTATFLTGAAVNLPSLVQTGGTLAGTDTVNITALFPWSGGSQTDAGMTNPTGGMNITGGVTLVGGRTLNNTAAGTMSGAGNLSIGTGGVFSNSGMFDLQNNGAVGGGIGGAQTFNNTGTLTKSAGGGVSNINATTSQTGAVNANDGTLNFTGTFTQTAGLTRLNGGALATSSTLTFSGGVLDAVGGSTITGSVNNSGAVVRPGMSPGILTITGNYTQGPAGTLEIELGGTTPGSGAGNHDQLIVGGAAALGGTLNVLSFGGFTPVIGDSFSILLYGSNPGLTDFAVKNGLAISTPPLTATPLAMSYVLSVTATADLAVTKTDSPDPAVVGQSITYTVTVTNNGPSTANNVMLTDTLPAAGITLGTVTPSQGTCGAPVGNVITCNLGSIASGANATVTIIVTPTAAGSLTNMASATTTDTDPVGGNNSATEMTTVNQAATSTALISSVNPSAFGELVTFTATVTVNPPGAGTPTGTVDFFNGVVLLGNGTLTGGVATFATSALAVGTHSITATYVGDTNFSGSTSAPLMQVVNQAATSTVVMSSLNPSNSGDNVTFTATVSISGPGSGIPTGTVDFFDGALLLGSGAVNATGTATFATSTLTVGAHSITATYNGDANFSGSTSPAITQTVNAQADVSVTKTDAADPVNAGQNVTYTITVANAGPDPATSVSLTDMVPANTTFVSLTSPGGWTCSTPPVGGMGTVTCSIASLANGANGVFTLVVSTSAASAPSISNTATVTAAENDPAPANNSATEPTNVNLVADISVTKTDAADPVNVGDNIVYTVTVSNAGPDPATVVTLTDMLPAAVTFVGAVPSQGACNPLAGMTLTCNFGTIASGANATVMITVTAGVLAAPSVSNTASVTTTSVDPNAANNTDTETTTVNPLADLAITKTDSPDPVSVGSNITYTITVTNNGPSPATGVSVSDMIPAGLTFVSATGPAGVTCNLVGNTITCTLAGMLNSGANVTATVVVTATAGAIPSVSNTATVTSAINDPNAANNSATAVTTVSATPPSSDFSVAVQPINNNVVVGQDGSYSVTVTSIPAGSNFANPVALMCSSPTGVCTASPNMLPSGVPSGTATITVQTSGLLGSAPPAPAAPRVPPIAPLGVLASFLASLMLITLGIFGKRTQRRRMAHCLSFGLALLVVSFAVGQSACATAGPGRQVAGPYTVTVTATSGTVSHSATVTLNVTNR